MDKQLSSRSINSAATHHNLQKSTTLNRRFVKRPASYVASGNVKKKRVLISKKSENPAPAEPAAKPEEKTEPKTLEKSSSDPETITVKKVTVAKSAAKSENEIVKDQMARAAAKRAIDAKNAAVRAAEAEVKKEAAVKAAKDSAKEHAEEPEITSIAIRRDKTAKKRAENEQSVTVSVKHFVTKAPEKPLEKAKTAEKKPENADDDKILPPAPNPYAKALKHPTLKPAVHKSPAEIKAEAIKKAIAEMQPAEPISKKQLHKEEKEERQRSRAAAAKQKSELKALKEKQKLARIKARKDADYRTKKKVSAAALKAIENDAADTEDTIAIENELSVRSQGRAKRVIIAFLSSAAVVAALGIIVRTNMPDISVRVAAMQTGIEASYPSYIPRGYNISSVYTSEDDSVIMDFKNAEGKSYSITESKSSWDSNALKSNYVERNWGSEYTEIRESGITVYVNRSSAAWVNNGILYRLDSGVGTLTKKQIKNIAASL